MVHVRNQVLYGNALEQLQRLPTGLVQTTVTSPPYFGGLRDYGVPEQIGLEATPQATPRSSPPAFAKSGESPAPMDRSGW